jgi:tetratricopeptide (TPR) repeat protein
MVIPSVEASGTNVSTTNTLEGNQSSVFVTDLNDLAALSLREGNSPEAAALMHQALDAFGSCVNYQGYHHSRVYNSLSGAVQLYSPHSSLLDVRPIIYSISADSDSINETELLRLEALRSPSNCFKIFNKLFIFHDSQNEVNLINPYQLLPHVPAVVVYNMAMLYHREAITEGSHEKFEQAREKYLLALRLLEENVVWGIYSCQFNMLLLAIYNNLGHIYSHYWFIPGIVRCRDQMLVTFLQTDCVRLMTKDEYIFFYMNLLVTAHTCPKFATAA